MMCCASVLRGLFFRILVVSFGEASEAAPQEPPDGKASAKSSQSSCQGVPKSQSPSCSPRCESSSCPELPQLLKLSLLMSAQVTAELWLACSPGQGPLGVDGVGFHLELGLGERLLFQGWCCVVHGDCPLLWMLPQSTHGGRQVFSLLL